MTTTAKQSKGDGYSTCQFCGSENLWSAHWNRRGLAVTDPGPNDRYRTRCSDCGRYQKEG
jgi:ribosomal protein S14